MDEATDISSIIDKCVKCGCRFITPEKPLKLLPCLHSMCLDCLYGRIPLKKQAPKTETPIAEVVTPKQDESEVSGKSENNNAEISASAEEKNLASIDEVTKEVEDQVGITTASEAEVKGEEEGTSAADPAKAKEDKNIENGQTSTEIGENMSGRRASSEGLKQNELAPKTETNGESEMPQVQPEEVAQESEPVDVKPKPATGKVFVFVLLYLYVLIRGAKFSDKSGNRHRLRSPDFVYLR